MVLGAAPIFLAGGLYEPLVGVGVLYVAVLLVYAAADALLLPRRKQITIERVVPERLSLGVPTRIACEVRNTTRRAVRVHLAEQLPPTLEAKPATCAGTLAPGVRATFEYRLVGRHRGRYEWPGMDVRVLPRWGLFYRQFRLRRQATVDVFPNLVNLRRYELLLRRGASYEQGVARLRRLGHGGEFESLRHYVHGDDMSRVAWKASAKRSRLVVKNYEPERQQSVLVALDVGRATAGEFDRLSRLDYLVNATLMFAYAALHQGDWFSLVAFSDRIESYLPPVRHLKSIERVARALYELEPRLVESNYGAACRFLSLKNRKRSLICLMTDVIDRDASAVIIAYMARFARYHLPLAVTLANRDVRRLADQPLARGADPYAKAAAIDVLVAREEALTAMRHQGVGVLDVDPRALTPALINRYVMIKATGRL